MQSKQKKLAVPNSIVFKFVLLQFDHKVEVLEKYEGSVMMFWQAQSSSSIAVPKLPVMSLADKS